MHKQSLILVYTRLVLTATFWGGTFIAGRVVAQQVSPFSAAFLRFAVAVVCLIFLVWKTEGTIPLPRKHHLLPLLLLGMTGIFSYNVFFFRGMRLIEAGRAATIIANSPIFIALLSAYFFKERLTPYKICGILLSVTGAIIVITRGDILEIFRGSIGRGELYILGCVASWVTYSLIGKTIMKDLSPLLSVMYSVLIGTAILFIPASIEGLFGEIIALPVLSWIGLFYLGFFGTFLAFIWYYQGIKRIGPMKAGLFINFVPISGVILAFVILGEPITPSLLLGVIFVSSGIYLTNKKTAADIAALQET
ncbi:EamA family transporter [candidate division KSB3 bacterium]|uniref:EamA family transporter n=1 Tax=candidate division KSB3 bacterium TaxID=2044937 RepID=A0A9D5Q5Z3_9BACT|nr:EamA family transporter [candidate division KSB3 bacterium]MBD3324868.1 EamA family transporter [candidate division KSB3 bacterium]